MLAILSLLFTLSMAMLVTRIAAMALMLTGMSRESARFQACSAFTGVGLSTSDTEAVVRHPVRRRIVMALMLTGNAGIATVVATVILSLLHTARSERWWYYGLLLVLGLLLLWYVSTTRSIERHLNRVIAWCLKRWSPLAVRDYVAILQLEGGFAVSELQVGPKDWLLKGCKSCVCPMRAYWFWASATVPTIMSEPPRGTHWWRPALRLQFMGQSRESKNWTDAAAAAGVIMRINRRWNRIRMKPSAARGSASDRRREFIAFVLFSGL